MRDANLPRLEKEINLLCYIQLYYSNLTFSYIVRLLIKKFNFENNWHHVRQLLKTIQLQTADIHNSHGEGHYSVSLISEIISLEFLFIKFTIAVA